MGGGGGGGGKAPSLSAVPDYDRASALDDVLSKKSVCGKTRGDATQVTFAR